MTSTRVFQFFVIILFLIPVADRTGIIQCSPSIQLSYDQSWQITSFIDAAGLARRFIFGIDFSKDGTAWIASADGLYRYDGYRWSRFTKQHGLPSNFVRCVRVTRKGLLWVGSDHGAGTYDYRNGIYQTFGSEKGLPGPNVRRIFEDPDGTLWFCCDRWPNPSHSGGLASFKDGLWKVTGKQEGLPSDHLVSYFRDSKGNQYAATSYGIFQKEGERWQASKESYYTSRDFTWQILEGPEGNLYSFAGDSLWIRDHGKWKKNPSPPSIMVLSRENELISTQFDAGRSLLFFSKWNGQEFVRISSGVPWQPNVLVEEVIQSPDGAIWAVGYNGLLRWNYRAGQWQCYRDLPSPQFRDPAGQIWFTNHQSVWVKQSGQFQKVGSFHGPLYQGREGSVWAWGEGKLAQIFSAKAWRYYDSAQTGISKLEGCIVDGKGVTWFYGSNSVGMSELSSFVGGHWTIISSPILKQTSVDMFSPGWDEGIWIVLKNIKERKYSLHQVVQNTLSAPVMGTPRSLDSPNVVSDSSGLWLYAFNGLFQLPQKPPGTWIPAQTTPHQGYINHLVTPQGTWFFFRGNVTGEPGIARHQKGHWEELFCDLKGTYSVSPEGEVELPSYGGFYIHEPGNPLAGMPFISLPGDPLPLQDVVKENAGEYWIGSNNGVFHYLWDQSAPGGVVQATTTKLSSDESLRAEIQGMEKYAPSYSRNQFQISYRIDQQAWSYFRKTSHVEIPVKNLSTGRHLLQVSLRNAFGKTNPQPIELQFEVKPMPLQARSWFKPGMGALLLLILGLVWNAISRAREISRTNQQLRVQITERAKAEESLEKVNIELEKRVRTRTIELSTANQSLCQQIQEREKTEQALSESEQRYRTLVENQGEGMGIVDEQETFIFVNPAAERIFGVAPGTLAGRNLNEFLDPGNRTIVSQQTQSRQQGKSATYEMEISRPDGEKRRLLVTAVPQMGGSGEITGALAVFRDDTERRQLEQQLVQSQKIESIGRLAGGVAHDFNNLLTVISGHVDLVLTELNSADPLYSSIMEIKKSGDRAAALTRQLLAFSRRQLLMPRVVDLNHLIRESANLLRRLIEENIELSFSLAPDLNMVKVDPGQMEQVLMNLTINARDAMPKGGGLTLETRNVDLTDEYVKLHPSVSPGQYVLIAVSDTGQGITSANIPHIFEPFFTTKEKGKGTGLGLSMVYGIIKQSGGFIWVYSEPGQGTCFKIYLPFCEESTQLTPPEIILLPRPAQSATILLVEDDEMVRNLASLTLQKHGFQVHEACHAEAALQLLEQLGPSEIDLLLTDVIMPQMSGRELAQEISRRHPGIKVLYMSGYTNTAITQHGVLEEGVNFIQKPFSPKDLIRRLHELLDAQSG
jgi:PAS domain S-box-containing protein